ncbi:sulfurtransferase [Candidatus Sumerlaeota bacterium]|nr:sulfurtransferase [Candidatus Sumerlaeota bacterium]
MNRSRWFLARIAIVFSIGFFVSAPARAQNYKGFERGEALITPSQLKALIDAGDPELVLIGVVRGGVTGSFTRGHIPGAYSAWRPDYSTEKDDPYPYGGMMINRQEFQEFARSLGIDNGSKVVLYDEQLDAARLWWGFYLYGKTDVRILDGGYEAWKAAGYETEIGRGRSRGSRAGSFVAESPLQGWVWTMEDVWRAKSDRTIQLWDTREPDEWSGERLLRGATRRGRVPWAKFLHWLEFRKSVNAKTPTEFKTAAEKAADAGAAIGRLEKKVDKVATGLERSAEASESRIWFHIETS